MLLLLIHHKIRCRPRSKELLDTTSINEERDGQKKKGSLTKEHKTRLNGQTLESTTLLLVSSSDELLIQEKRTHHHHHRPFILFFVFQVIFLLITAQVPEQINNLLLSFSLFLSQFSSRHQERDKKERRFPLISSHAKEMKLNYSAWKDLTGEHLPSWSSRVTQSFFNFQVLIFHADCNSFFHVHQEFPSLRLIWRNFRDRHLISGRQPSWFYLLHQHKLK